MIQKLTQVFASIVTSVLILLSGVNLHWQEHLCLHQSKTIDQASCCSSIEISQSCCHQSDSCLIEVDGSSHSVTCCIDLDKWIKGTQSENVLPSIPQLLIPLALPKMILTNKTLLVKSHSDFSHLSPPNIIPNYKLHLRYWLAIYRL